MVHVMDGLQVRPGRMDEVRRRVDADYEPLAHAAGMRRIHTWISPAVELDDQPTELFIVWEVDDVDGYWQAKRASAADERMSAFWEGLAPLLAGRTRRIMADPADPDILR
jgi:L-rhamnose mutarotase